MIRFLVQVFYFQKWFKRRRKEGGGILTSQAVHREVQCAKNSKIVLQSHLTQPVIQEVGKITEKLSLVKKTKRWRGG